MKIESKSGSECSIGEDDSRLMITEPNIGSNLLLFNQRNLIIR